MPDLTDVEARSVERPAGPLRPLGWVFIALYALAFMATSLVLIAPLLVTLALKVNSLVGIEQAWPSSRRPGRWWPWSATRSSAG